MLIQIAASVLATLWVLSSIAMGVLAWACWPDYVASMEGDPDTAGRPWARPIGVALATLAAPVTLPVALIQGFRRAKATAQASLEAEKATIDELARKCRCFAAEGGE